MTDSTWLSPSQQAAWRALISVHARLLGRLDAELQAAAAVSLADFEVLVHLSEAPGEAIRMAELAELAVVSPSGLTRRVDALVRDGLVERRPCRSDRRGSFAALTDRGRAVLEAVAPVHLAGVRRYVIDRLSDTDLAGLSSTLATIRTALEGVGTATGPGARSASPAPARPGGS